MNKSSLTLADVLELPALRCADAVVLSGRKYLKAAVQGTFIVGANPSQRTVRQGDVILALDDQLPDSTVEKLEFLHGLSSAGASGLILERRPGSVPLPDHIVSECDQSHLPVIAVNHPISFASLVQEVTDILLDYHYSELVSARRIHAVFTEISYSEADLKEVLLAARRLSGTALAIENSNHQLLDYLCDTEEDPQFTNNWEIRSGSIPTSDRSTWDQTNGWLVSPIGSPHKGLGRLILVSPKEPGSALIEIAERTAMALSVLMRSEDARYNHVRKQHYDVLSELLANPTNPDACRKAWLAGMPTQGRKYIGIIIRSISSVIHETNPSGALPAIISACQKSADSVHVDCIVAVFNTDVRALLGIPSTADEVSAVDHFARQIHKQCSVTIAAGTPANTFRAIDRTLRESVYVMNAIPPEGTPRKVYRLTNLHVRGLLTLLASDPRVIDFGERELESLISAEEALHFDVLATVRALIDSWESKSQVAERLYISRPVLYERIHKIESIIDESLSDVEVRTSLHLALLITDMKIC